MNKKYLTLVLKKVIETFISVKVLTIAAVLVISTHMVYVDKMDASTFATLNGSIISVVYALREGFKIQRIKEEKTNEEDREKIMV